MVIAIDGPAASGKSTLARRVAARYGLRFLDTGLVYRATARRLLDAGDDPADGDAARRHAEALVPFDLDHPHLRGEGIGNVASLVASYPEVRAALLPVQGRFAKEPPGSVLAGRDIGTVVCPDADAKVFVTASIEERARRRTAELRGRGEAPIYDRVLEEIMERDRRDGSRTVAPMAVAADAVVIDTTDLGLDGAFNAVREAIDRRLGRTNRR
ncbi:MAG: (d)CMP kinase [Geminicoccaceae bacterium]|nr:(d)CMP kinase [Geminicoccaceae bacterium]